MKRCTPLLLALLLCACSGPQHVSPAEFESQYAWAGKAQTVRNVTYLGQQDGRAFLRVSSMSSVDKTQWSDRVIYVELAELEPAFRDALPMKVKDVP